MLNLSSLWSWCWEEIIIVELKIKLLKLTGKQCWHWDRFAELGIKLLVLIGIFIVEFCYNLATIERQLNTLSSNKQHATHAKGWHLGMSKRLHVATQNRHVLSGKKQMMLLEFKTALCITTKLRKNGWLVHRMWRKIAMLKSMHMREWKLLFFSTWRTKLFISYVVGCVFWNICRVKYWFELKLTEQMFHGNRGRKFLSHERSSESNWVAIGIALFVFERP